MSQWTIQIESTSDGRYQWRHVPAEGTGTGTAHVGGDRFDTPEAARAAGEKALAEHHEKALAAGAQDALPETPMHDEGTRLGESQAELENQEDPRLPNEAGVALSNLPVEAEIRSTDERVDALAH